MGIYYFGNDSYYEGEWVADKIEGYGCFKWENGATFKGYFKNNKKHGQGLMIYGKSSSSKISYEGEFKEDKRDGFGILITK